MATTRQRHYVDADKAAKFLEFVGKLRSAPPSKSLSAPACWTIDGQIFSREEVLGVLKSGARAWNRWHSVLHHQVYIGGTEHYSFHVPYRLIMLHGADLEGMKFRKYRFEDVDFTGTNFKRAEFSDCYFGAYQSHVPGNYSLTARKASFGEAVIENCFFYGADLSEADFRKAYIGESSLDECNFSRAKFRHADLENEFRKSEFDGTEFKDATMFAARFIDCDLGRCKGLDEGNLAAAPVIDVMTLIRSGPLSEKFYRNAGYPDRFIDYLPSLLNQPIQLYSCFISYSSKDQHFADRLYADLQQAGVRCWFAPHDLKIGAKMRSDIDMAIRHYEKLLVILSRNSVASNWVEHEVETALDNEKMTGTTVLFPIRIDDQVLKSTFGWASHIRATRNIGDFTKWKGHDSYKASLNRLIRDLKHPITTPKSP